jgi:hypothetical protein
MTTVFPHCVRSFLTAGCVAAATVGMIGLSASPAAASSEPLSGGVFNFGSAAQYGWVGINRLGTTPVVAVASTPDGGGYWEVDSAGDVFSFGDAGFSGSIKPGQASSPVVSMAADPDGGGYWLVTKDGGVFSFGAAHFHGSLGGKKLNSSIVGMATTRDGGGYWLAAAGGGVFSFGDAHFHGSLVGVHQNSPVTGIASTSDGGGYWLAASGGGVFSFGDAKFHGSAAADHLTSPIVGIAGSPNGGGYWLVSRSGGVYSYGAAPFRGSAASNRLATPVVGMSALADGSGYWVVSATTSATACSSSQLNLTLQGTVQAGKARGQVWALANTSGATCDLYGHPSMEAATADGSTSVAAAHASGAGQFYNAVSTRNVALLPGESAQFWTQESGVTSGRCVDGAKMEIAGTSLGSPMNGSVCSGSFEVSAIGRQISLR